MHHGDFVTVLPDKLRMSEQELAPIGITDESICWARWVPDRRPTQGPAHSHLVVSPFEIDSWPALFHIRLILNENLGTLSNALKILQELDFNILSIEGTPVGHRHAVVNIIGEGVALKPDANLASFPMSLPDERRTFLDPEVQQYVHEVFAPTMLAFTTRVKEALYDGHKAENFLRQSFVFDDSKRPDRGTLYDPLSLPQKVQQVGLEQASHAVTCEWLQNHAFFWLYGRSTHSSPMLMTFDASRHALKPHRDWVDDFRDTVGKLQPPFKAISTLNYLEQYLRVTFCELDKFAQTFMLRVSYNARYDKRTSTKGLLSSVVGSLSDACIGFRSVSMSTQSRSQTAERGRFTFLASTIGGPGKSADRSAHIHRYAMEGLDKARALLKFQGSVLKTEMPLVAPFCARTLFLSTNFEWLYKDREGLIDDIRRASNDNGFNLVVGDDKKLPADIAHKWMPGETITKNVLSLIRSCDAFIQVIPRSTASGVELSDRMIWLLFESGAAHSLRIPCEICLDTSGGFNIGDWNERLKTEAGKQVNPFSGVMGNAQIMQVIRSAIERLSTQSRPDRSTRFYKAT